MCVCLRIHVYMNEGMNGNSVFYSHHMLNLISIMLTRPHGNNKSLFGNSDIDEYVIGTYEVKNN